MPRGRPKKANKLSHAEICRRSRNKRKQEDPEGFKVRENARRKRHYDKKKNDPEFIFNNQKNSLLSYYKNDQAMNPYLKILSVSKKEELDWGVELDNNWEGKYRTITPSMTDQCNMEGLNDRHNILWMITKHEKCAGRRAGSIFKFFEMLKENEITLILTPGVPDKIPYATKKFTLSKPEGKNHWDVKITWDRRFKRVILSQGVLI